MNNADGQELLSIAEAAKLLRLKPITLRKWDNEGKFKALRVGSRGDRRYRKSDVLKVLGQGTSAMKYDIQEMDGTLHPFFSYIEGFIGGMKRAFGKGISKHILVLHDGHVKIAYPYDELYELGEFLVSRFTEDPRLMDKVIGEFNSNFVQVNSLISKYKNIPAKEMLIHLEEVYRSCFQWNMIIEPLDAYLLKVIKEKLDVPPKDFTKVFGILTTPIDESFLMRQKREVLRLVIEIKNDPKLSGIFKGNNSSEIWCVVRKTAFAQKIVDLTDKYSWIKGDYTGSRSFTESDAIELLTEQFSHLGQVEAELEKVESYLKNLEKERDILLKKVRLNDEFRSLLSIVDKIGPMHDWRKEWFLKVQYLFERIFEEISKEYGIDISLIKSCSPDELLALVNGKKIDEEEIAKRANYCVVVSTIEGHRILYGKEAQDYEESELNFGKNEMINLLKGTAASTGVVIGIARVAYTAEEAMRKINKGDILVTSMTRPDFVPVMKKAAAIVTNEGGLTCHAAIVSREIDLPCVVGTRIATKIVNDGDMIEVNGNNGIIYIIKKAGI